VREIRSRKTANIYIQVYNIGKSAYCGLNMYKCTRLMAEFKMCVLLSSTASVPIFFQSRLVFNKLRSEWEK
jgi:hypothetical protein